MRLEILSASAAGSIPALVINIFLYIAHALIGACLELVEHILKSGLGSLRLLGSELVLPGSPVTALTVSAVGSASELLLRLRRKSLFDR